MGKPFTTSSKYRIFFDHDSSNCKNIIYPYKNIYKHIFVQETRKQLVSIAGVKNADVMFAHCCSPLPGDEILAHKKRTRKVIVHKEDCNDVNANDLKHKVIAEWKETFQPPVSLFIVGQDRIGFFAEVLNMVAAQQINVQGAQGKYMQKDIVQLTFEANITTLEKLMELIARIQKIQGVKKITLGALSEK